MPKENINVITNLKSDGSGEIFPTTSNMLWKVYTICSTSTPKQQPLHSLPYFWSIIFLHKTLLCQSLLMSLPILSFVFSFLFLFVHFIFLNCLVFCPYTREPLYFFSFCILLNLFTNQKRKRKNNILLMPNIPYLIGSQIFPINNTEHKLVSNTTPKKIPL